MLNIIALSPADGWAIVRDRTALLLVRPPYSRTGQRRIDDSFVDTAVSGLGFHRAEASAEFSGWSSLIAHLNDQVASARAEYGQTIDDAGLGERLLPMAPARVLQRFLERIRTELLPNPKAWTGAEQLLLTMLRLPQLKDSSELHDEAVDLLDRLIDAKRGRERHVQQASADIEHLFPRIARLMDPEALRAYCDAFAHQPTPMGV